MLKRFSVWLAVGGIVLAVLLVQRLRKVDPPPPPLAEPARAPFPQQIGARGIVEGVDENVRVAPVASGLVSKVLVKVGDIVKEGDPLVELDARDAQAAVRTQQSQIATLQAQIAEAEVNLADKRDQMTRIQKLSENRVASVDEKQRATFSTRAAETRFATMRAELENAQAQLDRVKVQLDLLTIRAPRDGTVLQVNIRSGEHAAMNATEPMILLGQVNVLQLRADVDEDNASRVRPGCAAVAFVKGRRDNAIPLRFVRIEPYIVPKRSLTGESSERVDTRVLQIIFHFEQTTTPVYVGQQMDVFLDAGTEVAPKATIDETKN